MVDYVDLTATVTEQRRTNLFNDKSTPVSLKRINRALIPKENDVIVINGDATKSAPLSVKRVRRPPLLGEEVVVVTNWKDNKDAHQKATVKSAPLSVKRVRRPPLLGEEVVVVTNWKDNKDAHQKATVKSAPLSVKRVRRPPLLGEEVVVVTNGKDNKDAHQKATVKSPGAKVYNQRGLLVMDGRDVCDCLEEGCVGCHYPCSRCQSLKCGATCRIDRSWIYKDIEVEEGVRVRKICFPNPPAPGTHKL